MPKHKHTKGETPGHWPKAMPFRVPNNYFPRQRREILAAIGHGVITNPPESARREIDRISPLLGEMKRNGVTGRWNESRPAMDDVQTERNKIDAVDVVQPAPVKRMDTVRWGAAAAAVAGLLLMLQLMTNRPVEEESIAASPAAAATMDSIAFSLEDISGYLAENVAFSSEMDGNTSTPSTPEQFLASADLLAAPEGLTKQMESIPVYELEAYINDVSPMVD
jgi:hypothetical protein